MARNVLPARLGDVPPGKARTIMPIRTQRTKGGKTRNRGSEMDWFAEDPWADPESEAAFEAAELDWSPDSWGSTDEDLDASSSEDEDKYTDDGDADDDDWGPIRPRRNAAK